MRGGIQAESLGKEFRRYGADRPMTLQETVVRGAQGVLPRRDRFWALRHVDLKVEPGGMLGVIGPNGAGKSTLLHLLGGVLRPDEGAVRAPGRTGALLNLGVGFHPDLTGRENVRVGGVLAGLTRLETLDRFDDIVAFAELESFIDSPLRTYSTGMQMRLGFAVAAHTDPDILLVDEVLAVGDVAFQQKCLERIREFRRSGVAVVLVSHEASLVRDMCDQALWLQRGEPVAYGEAAQVVELYLESMRSETRRRTPREFPSQAAANGAELRANENRFGSFEAQIAAVRITDTGGNPVSEIESGQGLRVEVEFTPSAPMPGPIVGVAIRRGAGDLVCFDTSTADAGLVLPRVEGRTRVRLEIERLELVRGAYWVDVGVYRADWAFAYDFHWNVYPLQVNAERPVKGVVSPPHKWQIEGAADSGQSAGSAAFELEPGGMEAGIETRA